MIPLSNFIAILISLSTLSMSPVWAASRLHIPKSLTAIQRARLFQWFSPATLPQVLGSPYPLGGFEGTELSLSYHQIPSTLVKSIDPNQPTDQDHSYPLLTFGKGLFFNSDLYVTFTPFSGLDQLSHFSIQWRYQISEFLQNQFRLTSVLHSGSANLNNQLSLQSNGFDLIGSLTLRRISTYLGLGYFSTTARFIGGAGGITDTLKNESLNKPLTRSFLGVEWPIGRFFVAGQIDRTDLSYYSFKGGFRL